LTATVAFTSYSSSFSKKSRMRRFNLALAFILATAPAFAHDSKGPNGGRIQDLGPFHAEFTAKDNTVELFVTDTTNKAVAMDGYKGLAIIAVGGKSERIDLAPATGNKLTGTSTMAIPPNAKGVVRLNAPDGKTSQAKFD
jgi:hypothetical protein